MPLDRDRRGILCSFLTVLHLPHRLRTKFSEVSFSVVNDRRHFFSVYVHFLRTRESKVRRSRVQLKVNTELASDKTEATWPCQPINKSFLSSPSPFFSSLFLFFSSLFIPPPTTPSSLTHHNGLHSYHLQRKPRRGQPELHHCRSVRPYVS